MVASHIAAFGAGLSAMACMFMLLDRSWGFALIQAVLLVFQIILVVTNWGRP